MSLRLWAVGGLGEFGANCLVLDAAGVGRVVVDTGVALGTLEEYGVGFEVPDFTSLNGEKPVLAVLTHAHDDHLKGLPFFNEVFPETPLAATPLTWPWIRRLLGASVQGPVLGQQALRVPGLLLEALPVSHSIPGTAILRFLGEFGTVVFATDFRLAPSALGEVTDQGVLEQWGKGGVDILFLDATNTLVTGPVPDEETVAATLAELVERAPGAVVAVTFASHAGRFLQLVRAAAASGRVVIPLGRGLEEMLGVHGEQGSLPLPLGVVRSPRELPRLPREKLVLVVTGSQGESTAVFPRLAADELPAFQLRPGDVVIHAARVIPGNEKRLDRLFDHCVRRGARVVTAQQVPTHTSGHAPAEELRRVLELLRPRWVVPVHGRLRHLVELGRLAGEYGSRVAVVENGQVVQWQRGWLRQTGELRPVGRILVDADQETVDSAVVWERKAAARGGVVVAVVAVPQDPHQALPNPHIECFGLRLPGLNRAHLAAELGSLLRRESSPLARDPERLRATMQTWLASELRRRLGKRPRVVALAVEL
ncbi:MAG: ribonuclease J [Thermoanaerobaculum sp.]|nr:ribonuclease J [Thermoanaerobaculum sp.]